MQLSGMKSCWGENLESHPPQTKNRSECFKSKKLNLGVNNSARWKRRFWMWAPPEETLSSLGWKNSSYLPQLDPKVWFGVTAAVFKSPSFIEESPQILFNHSSICLGCSCLVFVLFCFVFQTPEKLTWLSVCSKGIWTVLLIQDGKSKSRWGVCSAKVILSED